MKYKVNGEWVTEKKWKEIILNDYDHIMEYQDLPRIGTGQDGKEYSLWIELKMGVEEL